MVNNAVNVIHKRARHNADKHSCFQLLFVGFFLRVCVSYYFIRIIWNDVFHLLISSIYYLQVQIQGGPRPPLDPKFWGPKIEHFWVLFNFSIIFFASLCSAYYFFNMLLFHSSNWKIFQPHFARHVISHLEILVYTF